MIEMNEMNEFSFKVQPKRRNFVAKDLHTPKYRMRTVAGSKLYNRQKEKQKFRKEMVYD
jgi:hypothetical protein